MGKWGEGEGENEGKGERRQSPWEFTRAHGIGAYDRYDPLQLAVVSTGIWRRSISEGAYALCYEGLRRKE